MMDQALRNDSYHPLNVVAHHGELYVTNTFSGTLTTGMSTSASATSSFLSNIGNGYITKYNDMCDNPIRLVSRGPLNIPYGMAIIRDQLFVSNHGDGTISIFELPQKSHRPAKYLTNVRTPEGGTIINDGIWSIVDQSETLWVVAGNQEGATRRTIARPALYRSRPFQGNQRHARSSHR